MYRFSSEEAVGHENRARNTFCLITVIEKGKSFPYTIPSFPVFTVMLREAKLQWEEDGTVDYFDGFMRECGLLEHPLSAIAKVYYGYKNAFPVEVLCDMEPFREYSSLPSHSAHLATFHLCH